MAKLEQPFEDTQALFNQAIDAADLARNVNITVLVNNKAKEIFKLAKCNETEKFKTGDDINIFINEKIFEGLTAEQKVIVVEEAIASISFNSELDKITITPPEFSAHRGIIRKHTFDTIDALRESVKSLYDAEKQAEDARKAATEKPSQRKNFNG